MNNLTTQMKILNQIYKEMKHNFDTLKKMFKKDSGINQKICLAEAMTNQVYMSVMNKIETEEINQQFFDIIKNIRETNPEATDE